MVTALFASIVLASHGAVWDPRRWDETAIQESNPEKPFHPHLFFLSADRFAFSGEFVVEGRYSVEGTTYHFFPDKGNDLNHADIDKLAADEGGERGADLVRAYDRSMQPFDAPYDPENRTLSLDYTFRGQPGHYVLESYAEGDEQRIRSVSEDESGFVGIWQTPEPNKERLDSKTRFRIGGIDGLKQFASEAAAAKQSLFSWLDLRQDKSYRWHDKDKTWFRRGNQIVLMTDHGEVAFDITRDGKLARGGVVAFERM